MAAGLTLPKQNYEKFADLFAKEVEARVTEDALNHVILSDGELKHDDLTLEVADLIRAAGPWGQAFPEPVLMVVSSGRTTVSWRKTLKNDVKT